jgi:exosortase
MQANLTATIKSHKLELLVILALLGALYYPIIPLWVSELYSDPNYSHGFIVPLISGYFVYLRMAELNAAPVQPSNHGLWLLCGGLLLLVVAYVGTEYFTMRSSIIIISSGIILYLFGKAVFRLLLLPLGYLFFTVPIPYIIYDAVAFPLKLFITKYSVVMLKLFGIIVWREGNIIMFPNIELEVADACSGIRSLVSLVALGVAFAYVTQDRNWKRVVLVASAIPVSVFANGVRVVSTGVLAQYWGAKAAEGFFHEFAGIAVFALAIALLVGIGMILRRVGR